MKSLFATTFFILLVLPMHNSYASNVCHNPKSVICHEVIQLPKNTNTQYKKEIKDIEQEALKKLKSRGISLFSAGSLDTNILEFNEEVSEIAKKKFSSTSDFLTSPETILRIKNYLKQAIDKTIPRKMDSKAMKKRIDNVKFLSFDQFAKAHKLNTQKENHFAYRVCGKNGLNVNAFATKDLLSDYIVICSGMIIKSALSDNQEESFKSMLFTLGHELGHHIDSNFYTERPYKKFVTCVANRHAINLVKNDKDNEYCATATPEKCLLKVARSHMQEMISDQWALKIMNEYNLENKLTTVEKEVFFTTGMNFLCNEKDNGSHPSGNHRIVTQILESSEVNEIFSCQRTGLETQSCSL